MEEEKQQETSPETGLIDIEGYVYQVKRGDTGSLIRISKGDYIILKVYKEHKRKPVVTVLHCMIGQATKCWEEDHASKIKELEKEVEGWSFAALKYFEKYEPLRIPKPK